MLLHLHLLLLLLLPHRLRPLPLLPPPLFSWPQPLRRHRRRGLGAVSLLPSPWSRLRLLKRKVKPAIAQGGASSRRAGAAPGGYEWT